MDRIILGIDPGTTTGLAVVRNGELDDAWCFTVKRRKGESLIERNLRYARKVREEVSALGEIDAWAIEAMPWHGPNARALGHMAFHFGVWAGVAKGIVLAPSAGMVKMWATGDRHASKEQMGAAFRKLVGETDMGHDCVDAALIGLYAAEVLGWN